MPRSARIDVAGTVYHITCRGDRGEPIYRDDHDRRGWLRLLGETCAQQRWRIHAFCQMGNHFHLVTKTLAPSLSAGMRDLNGAYTQRFNARHTTRGHVFQGRLHWEIVQRQSHLLELIRYVILNPVRAGLVATPGGWPWSSYAMTCDAARCPPWLETGWLAQLGERREEAVEALRRFIADGVDQHGDRHSVPVALLQMSQRN
ncbi:transposase [Massilia sp. PWRC2]|uniref:transposase n=1 Tax=Massilia sp. PWRC2 TaxID=2804626 RepID=UPI003CFAFE0A